MYIKTIVSKKLTVFIFHSGSSVCFIGDNSNRTLYISPMSDKCIYNITSSSRFITTQPDRGTHSQTWAQFSKSDLPFSTFPFSALTLSVERQEGHPACKCVVCCWWRFEWSFARFLAPVVTTIPSSLAPIQSRMETFWYRLTQIHLENGC